MRNDNYKISAVIVILFVLYIDCQNGKITGYRNFASSLVVTNAMEHFPTAWSDYQLLITKSQAVNTVINVLRHFHQVNSLSESFMHG